MNAGISNTTRRCSRFLLQYLYQKNYIDNVQIIQIDMKSQKVNKKAFEYRDANKWKCDPVGIEILHGIARMHLKKIIRKSGR